MAVHARAQQRDGGAGRHEGDVAGAKESPELPPDLRHAARRPPVHPVREIEGQHRPQDADGALLGEEAERRAEREAEQPRGAPPPALLPAPQVEQCAAQDRQRR